MTDRNRRLGALTADTRGQKFFREEQVVQSEDQGVSELLAIPHLEVCVLFSKVPMVRPETILFSNCFGRSGCDLLCFADWPERCRYSADALVLGRVFVTYSSPVGEALLLEVHVILAVRLKPF